MRAAWVTLGSLSGFAVGFLVTAAVGLDLTGSSECDGPCFGKWDEVFFVALSVGFAAAVAAGLVVRLVVRRRDGY